jgi:hypothetical protein
MDVLRSQSSKIGTDIVATLEALVVLCQSRRCLDSRSLRETILESPKTSSLCLFVWLTSYGGCFQQSLRVTPRSNASAQKLSCFFLVPTIGRVVCTFRRRLVPTLSQPAHGNLNAIISHSQLLRRSILYRAGPGPQFDPPKISGSDHRTLLLVHHVLLQHLQN